MRGAYAEQLTPLCAEHTKDLDKLKRMSFFPPMRSRSVFQLLP